MNGKKAKEIRREIKKLDLKDKKAQDIIYKQVKKEYKK